MIQTQISLTNEQARRLRRIARDRRTSMAALIREAVDARYPTDPDDERAARWRRLMATAGVGGSGLPDLGEEHDRYLDETGW